MARSETRTSIRVSRATAERWHIFSKQLKKEKGWTGDETLNALMDCFEGKPTIALGVSVSEEKKEKLLNVGEKSETKENQQIQAEASINVNVKEMFPQYEYKSDPNCGLLD